ncbi:hypothetical protein EZV62_008615 [Acer yangbiense]|uniref:Uncharacterized protein n=1 Tax=Acer yangbiense TaxID=1000413 RepID=A0A5C7IDA6_9ROSI|nr:hypothetical protein EZV62_008615 [Acer yangbiense]
MYEQRENNPPNEVTEMAKSPEQQLSEEQPEEEEDKKTVTTEEKRPHESADEDEDSDSKRNGKKLKDSVDDGDDQVDDRNLRNVPLEPKEEEEDKKTVTEEKRPHESVEEDSDSDSKRKEKKLKGRVDGDEVDNRRNPRNVAIPLPSFLWSLEHDWETQLGFFMGIRDYNQQNRVHPFDSQSTMKDFVNNWLQVRVPWREFEVVLRRLRWRYMATGVEIGEGSLNSMNPPNRRVFVLQNEVVFDFCTERRQRKIEIRVRAGSSMTTKSSKNKPVVIGGSSNVPESGKKPEKKPLKQYKAVDRKWKMVVDKKQNLKLKLNMKMKEKMPEYLVDEERQRQRQIPIIPEEEKKIENQNPPEPVEKPITSEEDAEEEAWSNANFDTLMTILQSLFDYFSMVLRFPYEDVRDMEDFVQHWARLDLSVSDCILIIKKLKKYYRKQFWKEIDHHGTICRNEKQQQLYNCSDVLWNTDALMGSDDNEEDEKGDNNKEEEKKPSDEKLLRSGHVEGVRRGENLERDRSDAQRKLDFSELEDNPGMHALLPFLVKTSFDQGPDRVYSDIVPVNNPVPLAVIRPPVPSPFQDTAGEDNSGSMNRKIPEGPVGQCDDTEKPLDENPEEGGSDEAPGESKSSGEEIKDTKRE